MCLHHICGVHETPGGTNWCHHPEGEPADHPAYLQCDSQAHKALKTIILGDKLKNKLPYLARFR